MRVLRVKKEIATFWRSLDVLEKLGKRKKKKEIATAPIKPQAKIVDEETISKLKLTSIYFSSTDSSSYSSSDF